MITPEEMNGGARSPSYYETLTTRELKPLAQRDAKNQGVASAWIATAPKAALVAFLSEGTLPTAGDAAGQLAAAIAAVIGQSASPVDADAVAAIVESRTEALTARITALEGRAPAVHVVREGRPIVPRPGGARKHAMLTEVCEAFLDCKNVLLYGPAGTGKTTLFEQCAEVLGVPFGAISCTAGMSESHLLGRLTPDGRYLPSDLVVKYENPGLFLLDEYDGGDANVLLVLQRATSNGHFSIPVRPEQPSAVRHAESYLAAAGNTRGDSFGGAYSARNRIDLAFIDRWVGASFEVGYDADLERSILDAAGIPARLGETFHALRANVDRLGLERVVSTRTFHAAAKIGHRFDLDTEKGRRALVARMLTLWSPEDREAALVGVSI